LSDTNYAVIYDLHSHTTASDGCLTPEALVHRAVDDKLSNMRINSALMNRPTRGERRFAYWALFRFLAHWLAALGRSAAASGISSLKGGNTVIHRIRG